MRKLLFVVAFLLCCAAPSVAQPGGQVNIYVYATSLSGVKCQTTQRALWIIRSGASAGVYRCSATDTFTAVGSAISFSSPTTNRLAKFASSTSLSNSLLSDDGSNTTLTAGALRGPDGTAASPTYSFSNFTGKGLYSDGTNSMGFVVGGTQVASLATQGRFYLLNNSAQISLGASSDVNLFWDAANTLALRNSTNAQALRVYNTYTDGSNFERGILQWSGNVLFIGSSNAGTGTFREIGIQGNPIQFYTGASSGAATAKWQINSSGHLISVNGTEMIKWGTTSSFPALKRSGTTIQFRLADDGGFANAAVSNIFFGNLSDSGLQGVAPSVMRVNNGSSGGGAIAVGAAVGSRPTCDSTSRGAVWVTQAGAGAGDILQVCMKGTADTYAWRDVFTAP